MALGLKVQLINKDAVKAEYLNFVKQLGNEKISLKINLEGIQVQKIINDINKIQQQINNSPLNVNANVGGVGEVTSQIQNVGNLVKNLEKVSIKLVDGSQVQQTEQIRQNLAQVEKTVKNIQSGEIIKTQTTDVLAPYKELNTLQKEEFNLKNQLIGKEGLIREELEKQLSVVKQNQQEQGKLIKDKNLINETALNDILKEREKLQSNLSIAQNQYNKKISEGQQDLLTKTKQYQDKMSTETQLLQTRYKGLVPTEGLNNFKTELDKLGSVKSLKELQQQTKSLDNQFKQLVADTKASGTQMGQKDTQSWLSQIMTDFSKYGLWYGISGVVTSFVGVLKNGVSTVVEMEDALTDLNKVVDMSKSQMEDMKQASLDLGMELGRSSQDIVESMAEFGRYNKNLNDIKELSKTAIMASNVTTMSSADAASALNTAMITFKLNAKDSMTVLDSWNELQNNFRVSAEDLAASISKVGAVAKQSNMDINQLNALTTTLVSSMGISGDEAGTA